MKRFIVTAILGTIFCVIFCLVIDRLGLEGVVVGTVSFLYAQALYHSVFEHDNLKK